MHPRFPQLSSWYSFEVSGAQWVASRLLFALLSVLLVSGLLVGHGFEVQLSSLFSGLPLYMLSEDLKLSTLLPYI